MNNTTFDALMQSGWTQPEVVVILLLGLVNIALVILQIRLNRRVANLNAKVSDATIADYERRIPLLNAEHIGSHYVLSGALELGVRIENKSVSAARIEQGVECEVTDIQGNVFVAKATFYELRIWRAEHDHGLPSSHLFSGTAPELVFEPQESRYIGVTFVIDLTRAERISIPIRPRTGRGITLVVEGLQDAYKGWSESKAGQDGQF